MTVMDVGKGNQMSLSSSISHHQFRQLEKENFDAERSDFITPTQFNTVVEAVKEHLKNNFLPQPLFISVISTESKPCKDGRKQAKKLRKNKKRS
ncbi:Hypothetical predicted protein [Paramuricea clavata]|uniref:Uncharacterized protein n=1 Tax=Paramuricea clavata TaxID=317549 RepID=A0A7D9E0R1_PARCT|nr:Hypothetical predicted protein [Paramuricea clavata]